jgi:hypothetical protein
MQMRVCVCACVYACVYSDFRASGCRDAFLHTCKRESHVRTRGCLHVSTLLKSQSECWKTKVLLSNKNDFLITCVHPRTHMNIYAFCLFPSRVSTVRASTPACRFTDHSVPVFRLVLVCREVREGPGNLRVTEIGIFQEVCIVVCSWRTCMHANKPIPEAWSLNYMGDVYLNTHIHDTYIHTYMIPTYTHTCTDTWYLHTHIHDTLRHAFVAPPHTHTYNTYMHEWIHANTHTHTTHMCPQCIHTYTHACIHECTRTHYSHVSPMHTYIHAYIHTCMQTYLVFQQTLYVRVARNVPVHRPRPVVHCKAKKKTGQTFSMRV